MAVKSLLTASVERRHKRAIWWMLTLNVKVVNVHVYIASHSLIRGSGYTRNGHAYSL